MPRPSANRNPLQMQQLKIICRPHRRPDAPSCQATRPPPDSFACAPTPEHACAGTAAGVPHMPSASRSVAPRAAHPPGFPASCGCPRALDARRLGCPRAPDVRGLWIPARSGSPRAPDPHAPRPVCPGAPCARALRIPRAPPCACAPPCARAPWSARPTCLVSSLSPVSSAARAREHHAERPLPRLLPGCSSRWMRPHRRQPTSTSQVRGRATGVGTSSATCIVNLSRQPSNHQPLA